VKLRSWFVNISNNVGHSRLVGHESCEVWRLGLIIFWETLDFAVVVLRSFPWKEAKRAMTGPFKLAV
jgi:hypothetical protein